MRKIFKCLLIVFMALAIKKVNAEVYGSISGKVITATGVPVEGAKLELTNYNNILERIDFTKTKKEVIYRETITDRDGFYVFTGNTPRKYYVNINVESLKNNYGLYKQSAPTMPVELIQGQNLVDLNIIITRYYGTISGKVFKNDGQTVYPNEGISILKRRGKDYYYESTNDNGVFIFKKFPPESGLWTIVIHAEHDYVFDTSLNFSQNLDITGLDFVIKEMQPTGFYGTARNIDGTPFANGCVLFKNVEILYFTKVKQTDANGYFSINDLIPGEYHISVSTGQKEMDINSNFIITQENEQKELNLIYDDSKSKIMEDIRTIMEKGGKR